MNVSMTISEHKKEKAPMAADADGAFSFNQKEFSNTSVYQTDLLFMIFL